MKPTSSVLFLGILATILWPAAVSAEDSIAPGELALEPPTYICLGFQWQGTGDDNNNATATVQYRTVGVADWKQAMPLVRLNGVPADGQPHVLLAGSILDLQPDTEYECRLSIADPDGVKGEAQRTVRCRTRKEVEIPEGMTVKHVYPLEYDGEMEKGGTKGLLNAIWGANLYSRHANKDKAVKGGDILLLHAGVYKGKRWDKRDASGHLFFVTPGLHGYPLRVQATAEKPLVIKAASDGEVTIDGDGMPELFDLRGARHVIIEGLTLQNCEMTFHLSDDDVATPSEDITIRNCVFRNIAFAACGTHPGNRNVTFSDNYMFGRQQAVIGSWGYRSNGEGVVQVKGKGHVYRYNFATDVFDFFNVNPGDGAIDAYNNDLRQVSDNALAIPGYGVKNTRFLRNRVFNGGDPQCDTRNRAEGVMYYIRNIVFNQRETRAFKTDGGIGGLVAYHNTMTLFPTFFAEYTNFRIQNNLFLGHPASRDGKAPVPAINAVAGQQGVLDYNGYLGKSGDLLPQYAFAGKPVGNFTELQKLSGFEAHGREVDFSIFEEAINPHLLPAQSPNLIPIIDPAKTDLRPKKDSAIVDAGTVIPNVNEDFAGKAPDLGALELGQTVPHYGPRQPLPEPFRWREPAGMKPQADRKPDPGKAVLRVVCASPAPYADVRGNVWEADAEYRFPRTWGYVGHMNQWYDQSNRGAVEGTDTPYVYRFERTEFSAYMFQVPDGEYVVRLHFVERWTDNRVFDVTVNNVPALTDFNVFKEAGGKNQALVREISVTVKGGLLALSFTPKSKSLPLINGIEVFSK